MLPKRMCVLRCLNVMNFWNPNLYTIIMKKFIFQQKYHIRILRGTNIVFPFSRVRNRVFPSIIFHNFLSVYAICKVLGIRENFRWFVTRSRSGAFQTDLSWSRPDSFPQIYWRLLSITRNLIIVKLRENEVALRNTSGAPAPLTLSLAYYGLSK